jgi:hypothetical protein
VDWRLGQPARGLDRRVPELSRRYAQLHERAGTTPRDPVRVLAQLTMAVSLGLFLEVVAHRVQVDLPVAEVSVSSCCRPRRRRATSGERPSSQ